MFNGRDIFRLNDLNVNLEGMRRVLSQIDSKFAVPRTYSQMGDIIRGTFNPSNSEAILRALREFRLVR